MLRTVTQGSAAMRAVSDKEAVEYAHTTTRRAAKAAAEIYRNGKRLTERNVKNRLDHQHGANYDEEQKLDRVIVERERVEGMTDEQCAEALLRSLQHDQFLRKKRKDIAGKHRRAEGTTKALEAGHRIIYDLCREGGWKPEGERLDIVWFGERLGAKVKASGNRRAGSSAPYSRRQALRVLRKLTQGNHVCKCDAGKNRDGRGLYVTLPDYPVELHADGKQYLGPRGKVYPITDPGEHLNASKIGDMIGDIE